MSADIVVTIKRQAHGLSGSTPTAQQAKQNGRQRRQSTPGDILDAQVVQSDAGPSTRPLPSNKDVQLKPQNKAVNIGDVHLVNISPPKGAQVSDQGTSQGCLPSRSDLIGLVDGGPKTLGESAFYVDQISGRASGRTGQTGTAKPSAPAETAPVPALQGDLPESGWQADTALVSDLIAYFQRYLVLPDAEAYEILALWAIHTHVIDAFDYTPYLQVTAPTRGCGKTRVLETLKLVVWKPWLTGSATKSALVRKLHAQHPTLLYDEVDGAVKTADTDFVGILNNGFARGKPYSMSVGAQVDDYEARDFDVFGPKAFSGIGDIWHTVKDRSLVINIARQPKAKRNETRFREREAQARATPLYERIQAFAKTVGIVDVLKKMRPELPEALSDRARDIAEPLLAIAELLEHGESARQAILALAVQEDDEDADPDENVLLLADVRSLFGGEDFIPTTRPEFGPADKRGYLVEKLLSERFAHHPWRTWVQGRELNAHKLGKVLKTFKVKAQRETVGERPRGYYRKDVEKAAERYLKAPEKAI